MIKWQFANTLLKIFSVWFQFGKFCYENYEYKEQTGLKLQLGSPLKFSFLYAFSLATGSRGNTFLFEATFFCCRRPLCVYFSVMVSVGGQVITSILSQPEQAEDLLQGHCTIFSIWTHRQTLITRAAKIMILQKKELLL